MKEIDLRAVLETRKIVCSFENSMFDSGALKTVLSRIKFLTHKIDLLYPSYSAFLHKFLADTFLEFREREESRAEALYRPTSVNFDEKALINLTDVAVPDDVRLALSFGPKFCFPPSGDLNSFILFLDDFCSHLDGHFPTNTHEEAIKQLSIEFDHERNRFSRVRDVWLDFLNFRVRRFVFLNPDIYVTRSDKGKHTVLLTKQMYAEKLDLLVCNANDYLLVDTVNIVELEDRNNHFVRRLFEPSRPNHKFLDSCTIVARIYGLIKIHKKDFPMRPIVSACSSPGFKLAKFFVIVLNTVFPEIGFHIKNSTDFVENISKLQIAEHELMLSFDVVSMFTNIPIDHMIELISGRKDAIFNRFKIDFQLVKEALYFLLRDCAVFSWNGKFYKQKDSLAMGSPLSPILARILMSDVINRTLIGLRNQPKFLALYVDDSFWIVDRDDVFHILDTLNKYHHQINFTVEIEKANQINFLDVSIIRSGSSILTNWFKKPFSSSRLLNYFSHHERSCIVETAKAYVRMVLKLSNGNFFEENKRSLVDILRNNSFPETEIIHIMHDNFTLMTPFEQRTPFDGFYIPIKYWGSLTSNIKKRIESFVPNSRIVGTPDRCNSRIFSHIKDHVELADKSNLVLIFTCNCNLKLIRHSLYDQRAITILQSIKNFPCDSQCSDSVHYFGEVKSIQCKSYNSARRVYGMYTYAFRDRLIYTELCLPEIRICRQIRIRLND